LNRAALALAALVCAPAAFAFDPVTIDGAPPLQALWRAAGAGKRPAVLLLHGCGGLFGARGAPQSRYKDYASRFAAAGWHTLMPDSFGARGRREICTERERTVTVAMRRDDALRALAWLAARDDVDAARIAVVGWSHGASALLATLLAASEPKPAAAVAFYPGCAQALRGVAAPATPLLLLLGEKDDWTPPAPCQALAERWRAQGADVAVQTFADAVHGFDGDRPLRLRHDIPSRPAGVHVGGNAAARADALRALDEFLMRMLK
jgi:dienelactone hydrolase